METKNGKRFERRLTATYCALGGAALWVMAAGCGGDKTAAEAVIDPGDNGNYAPAVDVSRFVERIDNVFLPMAPGSRWVYESEDGSERVEVEVLVETRVVMGITATVVRDRAFEDDELIEDTVDWYAQDEDGAVWYLGEETTEFEGGKAVSTAGSWEAGVDGALPGIVMQAEPKVGEAYRQEYYEGEAEDMAEVLRLSDRTTVKAGEYMGVLVTKEWTPLEPDVVENKYYAKGVGMVLEVGVQGAAGRLELVSSAPGD